jgi:hypothetical protein
VVSDSDVYLSGYTLFESVFGYLKNNVPVLLNKENYYSHYVYTKGLKVVNQDVYVSGHVYYIQGPGKTFSAGYYWKNQDRVRLESDSDNEYLETSDLAVDQRGDVFITGTVHGPGVENITACLWKNRERMPLEQTRGRFTYGRAVEVAKDHIYVVGTEYTSDKGIIPMRAVYWKDGVKKYVANNQIESAAHDIVVN